MVDLVGMESPTPSDIFSVTFVARRACYSWDLPDASSFDFVSFAVGYFPDFRLKLAAF